MTIFKEKKAFSIKKLFFKYFMLLFICTFVVLVFYCAIFIKTSSNQISYNADAIMDFYTYSLQAEMDNCTSFVQKLCYSDNSFQLLTMKNLKDSDKVVLRYNVNEMLKRQVAPYECIFIFNEDMSISMYASGHLFSSNGSQYIYLLKEHLRDYWLNREEGSYNHWKSFQDDQHSILMNTIKVRDVYVCTTIDLNKFDLLKYNNPEYTSSKFGFYSNEKILSNEEALSSIQIGLEDLKASYYHPFFTNYYITTAPIEETDIRIFFLFFSNYMWSFTRVMVILFIILAFTTCIFILYIFFSINKILLYPLDQINAATKQLELNTSSSFLQNSDSNIIEYQNINHALANLIDQKISLNNEKQKEALEKDHARLQYYHLQTSSHFFANCLKSLYNMSESNEYEKMQRMIIAFSHHLRYVFHDNLKLVSLESELAEVNDYFNIILLDRATPIVLNSQVDEPFLQYQVPSLLIQTFLENTAKYNQQSNNLLIFDIKITVSDLNGHDVMQIQLSDNGIGYSTEMIEQLNSPQNDLFAKKHVGISNLKHRIALIYKSNYKFAFYNKPTGGACVLIYLPLIKTPNEKLQ